MPQSNDAPCETDRKDVESHNDDPYMSDMKDDEIINWGKCKKMTRGLVYLSSPCCNTWLM